MPNLFALELAFTETYRAHQHDDPALREAHCLKLLAPQLFDPPQPGELFVGRLHYPAVGFGLEPAAGGSMYYCQSEAIRARLAEAGDPAPLLDMLGFWENESTIGGYLPRALPPDVLKATTNHVAEMFGRLSGTLLDFDRLVRLGIPGLRREIQAARQINGDLPLYTGMHMALDTLVEVICQYAAQVDGEQRAVLEHIAAQPPHTLRQAAQLAWLYALIAGAVNYGRMDVYLGDFYARDLDSGRLSESEALALLQGLWRLIAARKTVFNGRVFLGGRGRPNEANANRFALAALEATRTVLEIEPQLTLRFYQGMQPALLDKALQVIGEGRTFPILYNDDVNIPAVAQAFAVSPAEAAHYLPYGCGEYCLDHASAGSPNCSLNLLKALEVVLHRGLDPQTGQQIGLDAGDPAGFETFEQLWQAYTRQVETSIANLAIRHRVELDVEARQAAFLYASLLYDDCLARGRSLLDGGARRSGGLIETYGMVNAADSLTAIRSLVYERKLLSLSRMVEILDADFAGFGREQRLMQLAPKFGNDHPDADAMLCRVAELAAGFTLRQASLVGLDYFLIVNINNWMNVALGAQTLASAEGRRAGKPLANGNTPTAGNDTSGVTAFLNSLVKPDPAVHAGYTQNMKFSKSLFRDELPKVRALLDTYFQNGGAQAMITVVGRGDLENALREPEKYRNLIVRVGGFSARFVELAPEVQQDLLARTLY